MRRRWWLAAPVALVLALGLWAGYTWRLQAANRELALLVEAERQRNFYALVGRMDNLYTLLGKGLVTGSMPRNMLYLSEVHRHADAAVAHLTGLPLPGPITGATGKFLTQVGDFAQAVARQESTGAAMTAAERSTLAELHQQAAALNNALQGVALQLSAAGGRWLGPQPVGVAGLLQVIRPAGKPTAEPQSPMNMLPGGLEPLTAAWEQTPALVYDGPFSDHVARRQPALTGPELTREQAESRMRRYLPDAQRWQVVEVAEGNGSIPTWTFRLAPGPGISLPQDVSGPTVAVEVARQGGHLVRLLNGRIPGTASLGLAEARARARAYLEAAGFANMEPSFGEVADGAATIQYVYRQGEILVYPDQVKVTVALDTGEVVGVDAAGYSMSHRARAWPAPRLSSEEAQEALPDDLDVEQVRLAVIPDAAGTGEMVAHEFRVRRGADTYLVYVNAETGAEERILQLIETETASLAY